METYGIKKSSDGFQVPGMVGLIPTVQKCFCHSANFCYVSAFPQECPCSTTQHTLLTPKDIWPYQEKHPNLDDAVQFDAQMVPIDLPNMTHLVDSSGTLWL
jgi:hypothetical protein